MNNLELSDERAPGRDLSEAHELVRAIRAGEVDAFVLGERDSYRVHALEGADTPYRVLVEAMRQGAATVAADGTVLYANRRLREMVALDQADIVGQPITRCLGLEPSAIESLLTETLGSEARQEIALRCRGTVVPALVSVYALPNYLPTPTFCLVITDVSERKAIEEREAVVLRERAALSGIFSRLPFAVFVADAEGQLQYVNENAQTLLAATSDILEHIRRCASAALANAVAPPEEITIARSDGTEGHYCLHANAVHIPSHPERAVVVATDVTAEHETRKRREQDEQFREMFVGILGHDLRSPLQVISSAATLLKRRATGPEQTKLPDAIMRAVQRMIRLTEDMLDMTLSRLGGGVPITRGNVELRDVVATTIEELAGAAQTRFLTHFEGDTAGHWDRARLTQVLSNLLSNAIKYGTESDPIHIRVDGSDASSVVVEVHNRGPSISADLLPVIFDPFRRGGDSVGRKGDGVGLGLFIADQIVRSHGGTISVVSSLDKGTTFSFTLPRGTR
jgi:PAS domain S-box-containing protein